MRKRQAMERAAGRKHITNKHQVGDWRVLSGKSSTEDKIRRLLRVNRHFGPILRACITVAEERGEESRKSENSGRFAGAWVIQALQVAGIAPPSNLRALACVGLIKLITTTRSGNRAYYTIPDAKGIAKALKNFRI